MLTALLSLIDHRRETRGPKVPYRYPRDLEGHPTTVYGRRKIRGAIVLDVVLDVNGTDRFGTIIEPNDGSEPMIALEECATMHW
jgi:hypothetical protein